MGPYGQLELISPAPHRPLYLSKVLTHPHTKGKKQQCRPCWSSESQSCFPEQEEIRPRVSSPPRDSGLEPTVVS